MNLKEIKDLVDFLVAKDVAEFELERDDVKFRLKRGVAAAAVSTSTAPAAVVLPAAPADVAASAPAAASSPDVHVVYSPIVGTFYEAASPGASAFVKVGDVVSVGQVLCIVEAMKLMNEIESDAEGTLVERYVENGHPVEYGQPLFAIRSGR